MASSSILQHVARHGIAVLTALVEAYAIFLIAFAIGQYVTGSERSFVRFVSFLLVLVSAVYLLAGYRQPRPKALLPLNLLYCSCFVLLTVVILNMISQSGLS